MRALNSRGFTLFELLVATAILAVVSAMAYAGLAQIQTTRDQLKASETRLAEIQLTFLNFERDLQQVVHRPIRDLYGTQRPPMAGQGDYLLELTRGGVRNPAHVQRSLLQRVAYVVEDEKLERLNWLVLDQAPDSLPVKQVLLEKITSVEIKFLDTSNNWSTVWPPLATSSPGATLAASADFPLAVSVKLEFEDVGTIERLFVMPEA